MRAFVEKISLKDAGLAREEVRVMAISIILNILQQA
jgi:hypothetical protein